METPRCLSLPFNRSYGLLNAIYLAGSDYLSGIMDLLIPSPSKTSSTSELLCCISHSDF